VQEKRPTGQQHAANMAGKGEEEEEKKEKQEQGVKNDLNSLQ